MSGCVIASQFNFESFLFFMNTLFFAMKPILYMRSKGLKPLLPKKKKNNDNNLKSFTEVKGNVWNKKN